METTTLEYNDTVYPFNMTAFRQALVYGINQSELIQTAFDGYGYTAYDSMGVSPSYWHNAWYNPNIKKYSYDPSQALSLLNSIGMKRGSDGLLRYPNGTAVSINLWAPTDTTVDTIGAQVLKGDLAKIGITVNIQSASTSDIIGNLASNIQNIARTGVILFTYQADDFGFSLDEVLPGPAIYWIAPISGHTWEWPAYVQNWYQGNISAIDSTNDQTSLQKAVWNIEAMNAQYLPSIILAYPDELFAYSTARFTGWIQPPEMFVYGSTTLNPYSLTSLVPVNSTSSTSATGAGTGSSNTIYLLAAVAGVVVVVAAAVDVLYIRRGRSAS
jgi:peptide/nickel transport system substrate-binding protein